MRAAVPFIAGIVIGAIVGALWIGPERVGELASADAEAVSRAFDSMGAAFASNDARALAGHYADGAVVLPPGASSVLGREAILAWADEFPTITEWAARTEVVDGCRDLAYLRADYTLSAQLKGVADLLVDEGRIVQIWRRQPDGSWRVALEIYNSSLPRAEAAEPTD